MTGLKLAGIGEYFKLLRAKHWIKNLFVLAPLIFAKELFQGDPLLTELKAFLSFCLAASTVYVINDITDAEADRSHPEKRARPLAARTIPVRHAYILIVALLSVLALLVKDMNAQFVMILSAYILLNLAYSLKLKEIVLLDVFIIAAGFMLRVLGGAYAIDVAVSSWIVLCTMFLSMFLGFAKRRSELIQTQESGGTSERKVLVLYRVDFIDQMLTIAAAGTVISYALYTVAPRTIEVFGTEKMIYTTVFVIFGVFRYLYLIHMTQSTENPTNAVTSDASIIGTILLWVAACVTLIYFGQDIR